MEDSKGIAFAIALLLFWIAGIAFFVAFHPGGVTVNGKDAQNPVDILKWLLTLGGEGHHASNSTSGSAAQSSSAGAAAGSSNTTTV